MAQNRDAYIPALKYDWLTPLCELFLRTLAFTMHQGMGGPHEFMVRVRTNDPAAPERQLIVRSDWGP